MLHKYNKIVKRSLANSLRSAMIAPVQVAIEVETDDEVSSRCEVGEALPRVVVVVDD